MAKRIRRLYLPDDVRRALALLYLYGELERTSDLRSTGSCIKTILSILDQFEEVYTKHLRAVLSAEGIAPGTINRSIELCDNWFVGDGKRAFKKLRLPHLCIPVMPPSPGTKVMLIERVRLMMYTHVKEGTLEKARFRSIWPDLDADSEPGDPFVFIYPIQYVERGTFGFTRSQAGFTLAKNEVAVAFPVNPSKPDATFLQAVPLSDIVIEA